MTFTDLFRFAAGSLGGHRLRTVLSLLGMAIGVAAVVALTALGEGARRYVIDQFASIGTNLLIVMPGKSETTGIPGIATGTTNDITLEDAEALARQVPEVDKVAPIVVGTEDVSYGARRRQVAVVGSTREFLEVRKLSVARGEFLPAADMERGRDRQSVG